MQKLFQASKAIGSVTHAQVLKSVQDHETLVQSEACRANHAAFCPHVQALTHNLVSCISGTHIGSAERTVRGHRVDETRPLTSLARVVPRSLSLSLLLPATMPLLEALAWRPFTLAAGALPAGLPGTKLCQAGGGCCPRVSGCGCAALSSAASNTAAGGSVAWQGVESCRGDSLPAGCPEPEPGPLLLVRI